MSTQSLAVLRVAVGLVQGIVLYGLYQASETKTWPATEGTLFAVMLVTAIFAPTVFITAVGNLRVRTLTVWTTIVLVLCAGAAAYDIFRDPLDSSGVTPVGRNMPAFAFWVAMTAVLFIMHSLVVAGDADRKAIAGYPTYFDVAWRLGVQLSLATLFTGLLWGLLYLGSELFRLITLEFLSAWMKRPWFSIPVTLIAFSYAVHVTDVRAGLVRGARTLKLTLESWLLPVMTVFVLVFLAALPVIGLEPLWGTRKATSILLWSAAVLVFLINAAYQDGQTASTAVVLRYSRLLAAIALVPLVALAGYALMLRVQQYGWTPQRIFAFACLVVACCYAAGYAFAALRSASALKQLEITNVVTAWVIVAALFALFSPVADPARISAADQVDRILSGKVTPDNAVFLRFGAGRYGVAALQRLAEDPAVPPPVSEEAKRFARFTSRSDVRVHGGPPRATPESRAANITVIHSGTKTLPQDLIHTDWSLLALRWRLPECLKTNAKCEAIFADLDGDGVDEIILIAEPGRGSSVVLRQEGREWVLLGDLPGVACSGVLNALRTGRFELTAPVLKDIEADGLRLRLTHRSDTECMRKAR